jgi:hypothetical protein
MILSKKQSGKQEKRRFQGCCYNHADKVFIAKKAVPAGDSPFYIYIIRID